MAVVIPLVTDFDGRGIKKAEKAFGELKTSTSRLGSTMKSALLPATAAVAGLAAAGYSAVKAAMEDAAAQTMLARQLKATTKATDAQIKATETFITQLSLATGVADDELRPALSALVRATGSVRKSQKLLKTSLDVSKGSGKSLSTVVMAITRAYGGNVKALARVEPSLKSFIGKTTTADQATRQLARLFEGAAAASAGTLQGKFDILRVSINETKESLGTALMPVAEGVANYISGTFVPYVQKLVDKFTEEGLSGAVKTAATDLLKFVQDSEGFRGYIVDLTLTVLAFGAAFKIGGIVAAFLGFISSIQGALGTLGGIFTTFAATSVGVITSALGLAAIGVYTLIDALRDPIFRSQFGAFLIDSLKLIANAFIAVHNVMANIVNKTIEGYNALVPGFMEIKARIPTVGFFKYSDSQDGTDASGGMVIPKMAKGGLVTSPTLAMVGEAGPEAVIPLSQLGNMGGNVTINVNGGDPQAVVDTITRWYRQNGATVAWMR